jgi:hypothetical protein
MWPCWKYKRGNDKNGTRVMRHEENDHGGGGGARDQNRFISFLHDEYFDKLTVLRTLVTS